MIPIAFHVFDAAPASEMAAPAITFRIGVSTPEAGVVHAAALRCQVQIEPRSREHDGGEIERLSEVFGRAEDWPRTLRTLVWARSATVLPAFEGRAEFDLQIPCSYDFEIAATKYLHAVRTGGIPLRLLFSGTLFRTTDRGLSIEPISWDAEAVYRMPASVWRRTMDRFFPEAAWLRVRRDTFEALHAFRGARALIGWDETLLALLAAAGSGTGDAL